MHLEEDTLMKPKILEIFREEMSSWNLKNNQLFIIYVKFVLDSYVQIINLIQNKTKVFFSESDFKEKKIC